MSLDFGFSSVLDSTSIELSNHKDMLNRMVGIGINGTEVAMEIEKLSKSQKKTRDLSKQMDEYLDEFDAWLLAKESAPLQKPVDYISLWLLLSLLCWQI